MRYLLILAAFLLLPSLAVSATIYVPLNYPTIQAAVDAATHGDVILLADGVYRGTGNRNIDLKGKAITLGSKNGNPETCIVDPEGVYPQAGRRGFDLKSSEGPGTIVRDLTITRGVTDDC